MTSANALGEFLRARRELLDPAEFDLPDLGPRRGAGLRRLEVAYLAGLSTPYYARLEQGTDRSPSPAVLAALSRVLRLDTEATAHLYALGGTAPPRPAPQHGDDISPDLQRLVTGFSDRAAIVLNRYRDVLLANPLATALNPAFQPGRNLLRHAFLDPAAHEVYPDWEDIAEGGVAGLRAMNSGTTGDPRLVALVGELCARSGAFRDMWSRHDVRNRNGGTKRYRTARAGILELQYQSFAVNAAEGQTMFLFSASPGTPDAEALHRLAAASEVDCLGDLRPIQNGSQDRNVREGNSPYRRR